MSNKTLTAKQAIEDAQKIAFAPFVFQTTVTLRDLGVLDAIFNSKIEDNTILNLSETLDISTYGLEVLLEIAESADIVNKNEASCYEITKTGYFLAYNEMVDVNLNFTNDVCYKGLFHLKDAIKNTKPEGLKELGNWTTIYEGLSQLDQKTQQSWFEFDHFYSDGIFDKALNRVFKNNPKTLTDIGCNTGKFTLQALNYNANVAITMYDLPGQLKKALTNVKNAGFEQRVKGEAIDWLSANPNIKSTSDVFWMSQFLDCFSKAEIIKILKAVSKQMKPSSEVFIIETFTDRQRFQNAKFSLQATSLYFTAMANGNSKMYEASVFETLIEDAGLEITVDKPLGDYHTMLICKLK
jgi:hypothetical protein